MSTFLDKGEKRTLNILNLLYSENRQWPVQELADRSHCSVRSVMSGVASLQKLVEHNDIECEIQVEKISGIQLITDSYAAVNYLEILFVQSTLSFQLIDHIFQSKDLTIEKLQQNLFLSRSSLYRKLNVIDQLFTSNGFVFSKNELTLGGSESAIREFFYMFYFSLSHPDIWPFRTITCHTIERKIQTYESATGHILTKSEKLQLSYRLVISNIRQQKKAYATELPESVQVAPAIKECLAGRNDLFFNSVPMAYKPVEKAFFDALYATYPSDFYLTDRKQVTEIVDWHKDNKTPANHLVTELFTGLASAFSSVDLQPLFTTDDFRFKLLAVANYALLYPNLTIDLDINDRWNRRFKSVAFSSFDRPQFTRTLWEIILSIHEHSEIPTVNPNHVFYFVYSLFSQWMDLTVFEDTLLVKLALEVGYLSELDLAQTIAALLPHKIEVVTSSQADQTSSHYDLVISDLTYLVLDYPTSKTYVLNYPPVERDFDNIKSIINEIAIKKMLANPINNKL